MNALYLYDDARARTFEPFASTRPLSEMISGAALIRERWKSALQPSETHFISSAVHDNFDEGTESTPATGEIPAGAVIATGRVGSHHACQERQRHAKGEQLVHDSAVKQRTCRRPRHPRWLVARDH